MAEQETVDGRCLCGTVTMTVRPHSRHLDACHCSMCRQWGGGPLIVAHCADDMDLSGQEYVTTYTSSEWAERAFCSRCGTHLYYRLREGGLLAVPIGLLEDGGPWQLVHEIFIDEKPRYYEFANDSERLTGKEVIARYGSP